MKMEVFVHSHYQTGEPLEVDIFAIDGYCHMSWFKEAVEETDQEELANYLNRNGIPLDEPCWIEVNDCWDDAMGFIEHYLEFVRIIKEG